MRHLLLVATLPAAFLARPAAQVPSADGPLVGMQLAFSIDGATTLGTPGVREATPYWKSNGSRSTNPSELDRMTVDFSPARVFGPFMPPPPPVLPYPDIDAMSMGLDFIPANSFGQVEVDLGHWNFMVFSVRRGTMGLPGAIRAEVGTTGGNEADFFHYVFRGASCIPPAFIDLTFKLADSAEVALPLPAEVDAADLIMNLYPLEAMLTPSLGMPSCPSRCPVYYYSFAGSGANLARVPAAWWGGNVPSGAAVFSSTWNGTGWSAPTVAYTPSQLGLLDCEDLDALAIDLFDPRGVQILFSTRSTDAPACIPVARDQVMFLQCTCDSAVPVPFVYVSGETVSSRIGVDRSRRDDDVDAICIGDPICAGSHFWEPVKFERTIGYPWDMSTTFGLPRRLGAQALREPLPPASGFLYTLFNVGGQPGGAGAMLFTLPALYPFSFPLDVGFGVPAVLPGNPYQVVVTFPASAIGIDILMQVVTVFPPDIRLSHAVRIPLN